MLSEAVQAISSVEDPSALDTPMTLPAILARAARRWPDHVALTDPTIPRSLTWSELHAAAERLALKLSGAGIGPGNAVAVAALPNIDFLIWAFAVYRSGAALAPLNLKFSPRETRHYLKLIKTEFTLTLVASSEFKPLLSSIDSDRNIAFDEASVDETWLELEASGEGVLGSGPTPDDPAYIIATSGSTGFPKPALIPHRAPSHFAQTSAWGMALDESDKFLNILPMFHLGGLTVCTAALPLAGTQIVLLPKFDPAAALELIRSYKISSTAAWDGFFNMIAQVPGFRPGQLGTLRRCMLAGSSRYFEKLASWGVETVFVFYGMTEGHQLSGMPPFITDRKLRTESQGKIINNVDLKIFDPDSGLALGEGEVGEIRYKGPTLMLRYVGMPDLTRETIGKDGYLRSGDRGYIKDGYLYYIGRYKFMVKTGGENVSELEVEDFLTEHVDSIVAAAVVGAPDNQYGEIVCAFVEWVPGSELSLEELRQVCRGQIANFKMPRQLETIAPGQWPRTATGKVDKATLREIARQRPASSAVTRDAR